MPRIRSPNNLKTMTSTTDPLAFPEADCRTPDWVTRAIMPRLLELVPDGWPILDAGCGSGAIADVLSTAFIVHGLDVRPTRIGGASAWSCAQGDFLGPIGRTYGAVVSNPPFTLPGWKRGPYAPDFDGCLRFTIRALDVADVACILHRSGWWHEMQPTRVAFRADLRAKYVTERWALGRVAFLPGGGVDSTPYAWLLVRPPTREDGPGPWPTQEYDAP